MTVRATIAFVAVAAALSAEELPRKAKTPRETYPNVDVLYDFVTAPDGKRLRDDHYQTARRKRKTSGDLCCGLVELRFCRGPVWH